MARPLPQISRLLTFIRPYLFSMSVAALLLMGVAGLNLAMLWKTRDIINSLSGHAPIPELDTAIGTILILLMIHVLIALKTTLTRWGVKEERLLNVVLVALGLFVSALLILARYLIL